MRTRREECYLATKVAYDGDKSATIRSCDTAALAGLAFLWLGQRALIAGDAVMTRDFFTAEVGYFNSVDFDMATETIRKIKAEFDFVIPGHDSLIPV